MFTQTATTTTHSIPALIAPTTEAMLEAEYARFKMLRQREERQYGALTNAQRAWVNRRVPLFMDRYDHDTGDTAGAVYYAEAKPETTETIPEGSIEIMKQQETTEAKPAPKLALSRKVWGSAREHLACVQAMIRDGLPDDIISDLVDLPETLVTQIRALEGRRPDDELFCRFTNTDAARGEEAQQKPPLYTEHQDGRLSVPLSRFREFLRGNASSERQRLYRRLAEKRGCAND